MVKYCDDPLQKHKKKISKGLKPISDKLFKLCNGKLKKNCILCDGCRKTISLAPTKLDDMSESSDTEIELSSVSSSPTKASGSGAISSVFRSLDLTPPSKRKLKTNLLIRVLFIYIYLSQNKYNNYKIKFHYFVNK